MAEKGLYAPFDSAKIEVMSEALTRNWWAVGLRGLVGIAFGIFAFLSPGITILSLLLVFAAYLLVDGIFAIIAAVRAMRQGERWGLLIFEGILNIAAAAIAVVWPGLTAITFVLLIGIWALISGGVLVYSAFALKLEHGRWWLALGGVASILFGIALLVAPLVGAVVLTWWIGAYALVFGIFMVVVAYRLWRRHEEHHHPTIAHPAR
jgi:uncharacterized membrane protein HdeD (DUF308 family)